MKKVPNIVAGPFNTSDVVKIRLKKKKGGSKRGRRPRKNKTG